MSGITAPFPLCSSSRLFSVSVFDVSSFRAGGDQWRFQQIFHVSNRLKELQTEDETITEFLEKSKYDSLVKMVVALYSPFL